MKRTVEDDLQDTVKQFLLFYDDEEGMYSLREGLARNLEGSVRDMEKMAANIPISA